MIRHQSGIAIAVAVVAAIVLLRSESASVPGVHIAEIAGASRVRVNLILPHQEPLLAHYTEHLAALQNTNWRYRPEDRHANAWTSSEAMGYWLEGRPEELVDILRKVARVFDPIKLDRQFAEDERKILLREYDRHYANNPEGKALTAIAEFLYEGTSLAVSSLGTPETILALSYERAKAFHAATHRPEFARLVIAGDVSQAQVVEALEEAQFPTVASEPMLRMAKPFVLAARETRVFSDPAVELAPRVMWGKVVQLPEQVDYDLLILQCKLLQSILESNLVGGLGGPLRFDASIAKSFSLSILAIDEQHVLLSFVGELDRGVTFERLRQGFETSLAASARGIPRETFNRVRDRFEAGFPAQGDLDGWSRLNAETVLDRVSSLRQPKEIERLHELGTSLQAQDIVNLLRTLAGPCRLAIANLGKDTLP
jgi:predicted Zn-dependent peptidase